MSSSDEEEEMELDCNDEMVFTKYGVASEIANKTLKGVIMNCKSGMDALKICEFGDKVITLQTDKVYKAKKIKKGIAFPTCVSVNECVCHFSPLQTNESVVLKTGDIVKIDLGVHIDGYIASVAHTMIVEPEDKIEGPLADLFTAARYAVEAAHKVIKPGNSNADVTKIFDNICKTFNVNMCEGVLTHQLKRFVIDGNKVIIGKENHEQKVNDVKFEAGEVYAVDICMSTGEGKPRVGESRTTVYKRVVDATYRLKRASSRFVLNEVNKKFPTLPFNVRSLSDATKAKAGVIECVKNDLLQAYDVLYEKDGAHVVHFKFTVLLRNTNTARITGTEAEETLFKGLNLTCDKTPDDELRKVLATSTKRKKRRKRGKKKKKKAPAEASA